MTTKRKSNGTLGLALLAALTLVIGGVAGPVASAAGGESTATVAKKKKCKKKGKKAEGAKKKGCKKKKKKPRPAGRPRDHHVDRGRVGRRRPRPVRVRRERQRLATGLERHPAVDHLGRPAGPRGLGDVHGPQLPNAKRPLSFGVCYQVGGSVHAPFTITYVTADGQTHTDSQDPGSSFHYDYPGGAPIPTGYCPD